MRVRAMTISEEGTPDMVTVEMTIAEVALIAKYVGALVPSTPVSSEIWNALSDLACRFWDDGVDEMARAVRT